VKLWVQTLIPLKKKKKEIETNAGTGRLRKEENSEPSLVCIARLCIEKTNKQRNKQK
jgi:hypothetical protein